VTDADLVTIDQRIQRAGAANCWTGTLGSLATDARRLVRHIQEQRKMSCEYPVDHILQGERELRNNPGDEMEPEATVIEEAEGPPVSGTTAKFGTGAVRSDTVEAFRYDLVSPIGLREVARTCAEGAAKYGDWNWEKGMPVHDLLNHAIAHLYQFLSGDRNEPHLGHAAWNVLAAIHSQEMWPHLNEGNLRKPGCCHPSAPPADGAT
jgi:hypothetical protein